MLTQNADIAMYYAKASGRNNAKLYQTGMLVIGEMVERFHKGNH